MRHKLLRFALTWTLLALLGCKNDESEGECSEICGQLRHCSLLPSPLGRDRSDCERRCRRSNQSIEVPRADYAGQNDTDVPDASAPPQPTPYAQIQSCYDNYKVDKSLDAGACDSKCAEFAKCLEHAFSAQEHIVGTGELSLLVLPPPEGADVDPEADAGADVPLLPVSDCRATELLTSVPDCNNALGAATAQCENIKKRCNGITSMFFFIEISDRIKHSTYFSSRVACAEFFAKPNLLPRLPAGTLTAQVRARRPSMMLAPQSNAETDAGTPLEPSILGVDETTGCLTLDAYNVLIRAGEKANRAVSLTQEAYDNLQKALKDPAMTMFSEPCVRETKASGKNIADAGSSKRP